MRRLVLPLAALAAVLGAVASGHAQQWTAEAQAGRLTYDAGAAGASPASLLLGVGYENGGHNWLSLSAGVPVSSGQQLWGAVSAGTRLAARAHGFLAGIDLSASGFAQPEQVQQTQSLGGSGLGLPPGPGGPGRVTQQTVTGWALAGEALPVLGATLGAATVEASYGLARFQSAVGSSSTARSVRVGRASVMVTPAPALQLRADGRRLAAPEGDYTYGGLRASLARERAAFWASVGHWFAVPSSVAAAVGTPWMAGAAVQLTDRAVLTLSARRVTLDPIYAAPPHTSWGLGVSYRIGGGAAPAAPVPASYKGGVAVIALPLKDASRAPRIAGDFNHWKPAPMTRDGHRWVYRVRLAPGVYHYAFVRADGKWFVPKSVPGRTSDGMGGTEAVLVVR